MTSAQAAITHTTAETLLVEAHGFLFQYPAEAAADVSAFLA